MLQEGKYGIMDDRILNSNAFAAIHDLKYDTARLSGCIDRLADIADGGCETDSDEAVKIFLREYEAFLIKYENSVNDKIRVFVAEIKGLLIEHKAELAGIGLDMESDGRLALSDVYCRIKYAGTNISDKSDSVFVLLNEVLLNAEIHMERFIPEKYLSYDRQRDYRILKQEGNIYAGEV